MPSNPVSPLSQTELKQLHKLLHKYHERIYAEQPLAAEIIYRIMEWVRDDIAPKEG